MVLNSSREKEEEEVVLGHKEVDADVHADEMWKLISVVGSRSQSKDLFVSNSKGERRNGLKESGSFLLVELAPKFCAIEHKIQEPFESYIWNFNGEKTM